MSTVQYPKETTKVHKHFDLDKEETVVTHFACAHKGRMLKQGRLYITQNHLCFYAQVVGKVHKKTIKLIDVDHVAKTNYGVFPNAIKVTTTKRKEVVFASFLMRDQAFDAIRKEWLSLKGDDFEEKEDENEKRGASPSPRRGSIEPSGSESEKEKKKKKKRFSFSKQDKKRSVDLSDQTAYSDTELVNDEGSKEAQRRHSASGASRRHSASSTSSNDRSNEKHSAQPTPTQPPTMSSATALSRSSTSTQPSSRSSSTQPSATRPPSTSLSASSTSSVQPPTTPSSSRGDRAQALISSGAIKTTDEPTPQSNRQSQTIEAPGDPTGPDDAPAPSFWQRLCYWCY